MTNAYCDVPLLKPPASTWEVPLCFFVPLLLRAATRRRGWRTVASCAALAGSLLTRPGWIAAGRASAKPKHAANGFGMTRLRTAR